MCTNLPIHMRQVVVTQPGEAHVLDIKEINLPTPQHDDILIKVYAAGVNRPDIMQRMGNYPPPKGANPILGLEISGTVVKMGPKATMWDIGSRVCALTNGGGYAEYCLVPETQVLPVPKTMGLDIAAAAPETFFTVWANLFMIAQAEKGETLLVHGGASGIGTTALMLAKAFGLKTLATVGSKEKCYFVTNLGADTINYHEQNFEDFANEKTRGAGVDIILDIIGAPYFKKNLNILSRHGRLVLVGLLGGGVIEEFNLAKIIFKNAIITGSALRPRSQAEKAYIADALKKNVVPLWEKGKCLPILDRIFSFTEVQSAHRFMESNQNIGKIILKISDEKNKK